jgi:hypothetical protein
LVDGFRVENGTVVVSVNVGPGMLGECTGAVGTEDAPPRRRFLFVRCVDADEDEDDDTAVALDAP